MVFHTQVVGLTTSDSVHPRVELREIINSGADKAAWGSNDGKTHTMTIVNTVTHLTTVLKSNNFLGFDNTMFIYLRPSSETPRLFASTCLQWMGPTKVSKF